jgi:hypothetical protein
MNFLKYKTLMMIIGVVAALTAIIYFIGRRAGKNAASSPWNAPLPADGQHATGLLVVDPAKVRTVSDDLYLDLKKWDWNPITFSRNVAIYEQFNSLSDTEFVAVYNDWNIRFSKEFNGKSLLIVIKDETGWGLARFNSLRNTIVQRCQRLKLV